MTSQWSVGMTWAALLMAAVLGVACAGCDTPVDPGMDGGGGSGGSQGAGGGTGGTTGGPGFASQISSGTLHTCELRTDDSIWCWGWGNQGQLGSFETNPQIETGVPTRVPSAEAWKQVSAGGPSTCAVARDGTLWCWGMWGDAQVLVTRPQQIGSDTNWAFVSSGGGATSRGFACGLRTDGTLSCFGAGMRGQLGSNVTAADGTFTVGTPGEWAQVDAAGAFACGVKKDGSLWCWGASTAFVSADGGFGSDIPVRIGTASDWKLIAAGETSACGLKTSGSLWCWAFSPVVFNGMPTEIAPGEVFESLDVNTHLCAVKPDGTAWCIGNNNFGQVGDGVAGTRVQFSQVGAASDWAGISTGGAHTCGVRDDGTRWCWGQNGQGQLGLGMVGSKRTPVEVREAGPWSTAAAGDLEAACAVKADGSLWCWGLQAGSQSAFGSRARTPARIGVDSNWARVDVGHSHRCALRSDQTLWCWGLSNSGALGVGADNVRADPTQLGAEAWSRFATGREHTCGVRANGTLWCWGNNRDGQVGDGTSMDRRTPTQVGTDTDWAEVTSGGDHNCALKTNGSAFCWGDNSDGQSGAELATSELTAPGAIPGGAVWRQLSAGDQHTCGTRTDGSLWCWGDNGQRRLGVELSGSTNTPTRVGTASDWVQVASGDTFTCATKTDKSVWCWGSNIHGEAGTGLSLIAASQVPPTRVASDVAFEFVSAGAAFALARASDGRLFSWGRNSSGQLGDGDAWRELPVKLH